MKLRKTNILLPFALFCMEIHAQTVLKLDLEKTITMANDSSLSAFRFLTLNIGTVFVSIR